jgi:hypothetical protein
MRIESIETLSGEVSDDNFVLRQRFCSSAQRLRDSIVAASGILLALPIAAIVADSGARKLGRDMIVSDPTAIGLLGLCAVLAAAAIVIGLTGLARPDLTRRTVAVDPDGVVVEDIVGRRAQRWREAISAYRGVRHKVSTTSSGARHVLMLEHETPARTVHLAFEPYISQAHVIQTADRFGLPVLEPLILPQSSIWRRLLSQFGTAHGAGGRAAREEDMARA